MQPFNRRNHGKYTKVVSSCVLLFALLGIYMLYTSPTYCAIKRNFQFGQQLAASEYHEGSKFLAIMAYDSKAASYGNLTNKINGRYCQKHGYGLLVYHVNSVQYCHATIDKIHYVHKALKDFPNYEYCMQLVGQCR